MTEPNHEENDYALRGYDQKLYTFRKYQEKIKEEVQDIYALDVKNNYKLLFLILKGEKNSSVMKG